MEKQLKTLLLLYEKKCLNIPKDIKTLFFLETIISYLGPEEALIFIAGTGRLNWVRYLVEERGADISYREYKSFRRASEKGHLEAVKYLVGQGAHFCTKDDYALRWASENCHLEVVKYLVDRGANIHARDDWPLVMMLHHRHYEVYTYMIEKWS